MSGGLFLGLELATEQLRASVVDEGLEVIAEVAVDFDGDLPQYLTEGGVVSSPPNCTPADMWIHALDLLIERLSRILDISRIKAIGGSAQHALVFCKPAIFPQLNPRASLQAQLPTHLFLAQTNVYTAYDASSYTHALALQVLLGGPKSMASRVGVTANACPTMFAGQMLRMRASHMVDCWSRTGRVLSASSFLASLIVGRWVGMGTAEAAASGMYNPVLAGWDEHVLDAVGGSRDDGRRVRTWLGPVDDAPRGKLGHVNRYWVERYHFEPSTIVTPFIPDFLASYLSLAPTSTDCAIIFDASNTDVLLSPCSHPTAANPRRLLIPHPIQPSWISVWMTPCATASRNRALVQYAKTWGAFSRLVEVVPPGGSIGLDDKLFSYWSIPSSPPPSGSNNSNAGGVAVWRFEQGHQVTEFRDLRANPRVLLESQLFALKIRSRPFLTPRPSTSQPAMKRVLCVGEAALVIPALSEVLASVFCAEVYTPIPLPASALSPTSPPVSAGVAAILSDTERYRAANGSAFAARYVWSHGGNTEVRYEEDTRRKLSERRKTIRTTSTGSVHPIGHAPALSVLVEEPEEMHAPHINLNDDDDDRENPGLDRHEHLLSMFADRDRNRSRTNSGGSSPLGRSTSKRWDEPAGPTLSPEELELMAALGLVQSALPDRDVCDAYGSLIPEFIRLGDVVRRAGG